jgi:hypothetical protein
LLTSPSVTETRRAFNETSRQIRNALCRIGTACRWIAPILSLVLAWSLEAHASEPLDRKTDAHTRTRESKSTPLSVYATGGIGGTNIGLSARGLLTVAHGRWFVGATAVVSSELSFGGPSPHLQQEDVGVLAGLHTRGRFWVAGAGAGLAYVHSIKRGAYLGSEDDTLFRNELYEQIDRTTIGVPVVAHASVYWGPVGIGGMTFLNLNDTLPIIGAAGTLSLGMF